MYTSLAIGALRHFGREDENISIIAFILRRFGYL